MAEKYGLRGLRIGGVKYKCAGHATYDLGISRKEAVTGADSFHGHKITPKPGRVQIDLRDSSDIKIEDLQKVEDQPLTVELENGKVISYPSMTYSGEGETNSEEGVHSAEFTGAKGKEV